MIGYEDYQDILKKTLLDPSMWTELKNEKHLTLLIGSGVTSHIVGDWKALLNEIAMMRYWSNNKKINPASMHDYIKESCKGCFLPDNADSIEKGEYLRYDRRDYLNLERDLLDHWREVLFSHRVLTAIERLMNRKLRDGTYKRPHPYTLQKRYEEDFISWCNDEPDPVFGIGRRTISKLNKPDVAKKVLEKFTNKMIAQKLSLFLRFTIDITEIEKSIREKAEPFEQVKVLLGPLMNNSIEKTIRSILKKAQIQKDHLDEYMGELFRFLAVRTLWMPDYYTLEALLRLCMRGHITDVISYNFDTVFDRLLASRKVQEVLKNTESTHRMEERDVCVYGMHSLQPEDMKESEGFTKKPTDRTIRIYHVHGILDRAIEIRPIVFSETSYKTYQDEPLNIEKTYITNAFQQRSLLCVGFSGKDGSFRNVLDQVNSARHIIIFGVGKIKNRIYLAQKLEDALSPYPPLSINPFSDDIRGDDFEIAYACANTYLEMLQDYYGHYEAKILWIEDYDSLAAHLAEI